MNDLKSTRDEKEVNIAIQKITNACSNGENLMPLIIAAAKAYATLGEIVDSMKIVFGEWTETSII